MTDTSAPTQARTRTRRDWRLWLALATVYLVWGSTYLAVRVMVETVPPLLGSGVRFLVAGAVLYPVLLARRGWAAVRVAAMPLVVVLLRLTTGERVPRATVAGVAAGLAGVAVLVLPGNPAPEAGWFGLALILVADASMAVASFASGRLPVPDDTLVATALELLAAGAVLGLAGLLAG